jgi:hypothetical protein
MNDMPSRDHNMLMLMQLLNYKSSMAFANNLHFTLIAKTNKRKNNWKMEAKIMVETHILRIHKWHYVYFDVIYWWFVKGILIALN